MGMALPDTGSTMGACPLGSTWILCVAAINRPHIAVDYAAYCLGRTRNYGYTYSLSMVARETRTSTFR